MPPAQGKGAFRMSLSVLFVRHGESEANLNDMLVSEHADPPLTDRGRQEARMVAHQWMIHPPTAIYASPLKRSIDTAKIWAEETHASPVQIDPRLHEIRLGEFDGRRIQDLLENDRIRYQLWKSDPESPPRHGEKLSAVGTRMMSFLSDMSTRYESGFVVAITHADCLKAVTLHILQAPWQSARFLHFSNVAGVHVTKTGSRFELLGLPCSPPAHDGSL